MFWLRGDGTKVKNGWLWISRRWAISQGREWISRICGFLRRWASSAGRECGIKGSLRPGRTICKQALTV